MKANKLIGVKDVIGHFFKMLQKKTTWNWPTNKIELYFRYHQNVKIVIKLDTSNLVSLSSTKQAIQSKIHLIVQGQAKSTKIKTENFQNLAQSN